MTQTDLGRSSDASRARHARHLDVRMPRLPSVLWAIGFVRTTWTPILLGILGRWFGSAVHVLAASLIGYATVKLGRSEQGAVALPDGFRLWLEAQPSPVSSALVLSAVFLIVSSATETLVTWTRAWIHVLVNREVTPRTIECTVRSNPERLLDPSTAVQRWLLKTDLVYFLHESVAATAGYLGTVAIALAATYRASTVAGHTSVLCLAVWGAACVPLTIGALRAGRASAHQHEEVGRAVRDGASLRSDLTRPSQAMFWKERHREDVMRLGRAIARQGLWNALLEGVPNTVARLMPIAAMLAALRTSDLGTEIAILLYLSRLVGPLASLAGMLPWLQTHLISLTRMYEMLVELHRPLVGVPTPVAPGRELVTSNWVVNPGDGKRLVYSDFRALGGSVCCVVGPSGSGKSTLLRSLVGLQRRESGDLSVDGQSIDVASDSWHESCGFVPQQPELVPGTLSDNLHRFSGWRNADVGARLLQRIFDSTDLNERVVGIDDPGVSVGQRRVISVLRSIGADARVLLLDEPFAGLDDGTAKELADTIRLACRNGRIVILTSHEHDLARVGMTDATTVRLAS